MGNKKNLKTLFFERGVSAINVYKNMEEELYYCPICGIPFDRQALADKILTLEHIPPKAQGGKGIALTCSKCNNTAGHTVDAAVINRNEVLGIEPLFTQKGKYSGRLKLNFGKGNLEAVNADLSVEDSKVRIYLVGKSNHPDTSERIKYFFTEHNQNNSSGDGSEIKFSTRQRYHFQHSKVGDLRSAFLVCFAFFGYRYAFDKRLNTVRKQIVNYDEKIIDGYWFQSDIGDEPETNLYMIDKPFQALSVRIGKNSILLPWLDSPENFYDFVIKEYLPDGGRIIFSGGRLKWPQSLEMNLDMHIRKNNGIQSIRTQPFNSAESQGETRVQN